MIIYLLVSSLILHLPFIESQVIETLKMDSDSKSRADYDDSDPEEQKSPKVGATSIRSAPKDQVERVDRNNYKNRNACYRYIRPRSDPFGWNELLKEGCYAWKAVIAEFMGVFVLVFLGCGSCIDWNNLKGGAPHFGEPSIVQIALAFGTARATIAQAIGHISGTHVNPGVTIGMVIGKKIKPIKALFYIIFQVLGAIAGTAVLRLLIPDELRPGLGQTLPSVENWQALVVEALITFMLTITVFGVCDELRSDIKGSAPLMIGFIIMTNHLMAVRFTGSSMNPARSTGPALIGFLYGEPESLKKLWIYWVGPVSGSILAGLMYVLLLHKEEVEAATVPIAATGPQSDQIEDDNGIGTSSSQSVEP